MKNRFRRVFDKVSLDSAERNSIIENVVNNQRVEREGRHFWQTNAGGIVMGCAALVVFVLINAAIFGGMNKGAATPMAPSDLEWADSMDFPPNAVPEPHESVHIIVSAGVHDANHWGEVYLDMAVNFLYYKERAMEEECGYQELFDEDIKDHINNGTYSGIPSGSWIVSIGADDNLLDNAENLELVKMYIDTLAANVGFEVKDMNIYPSFGWMMSEAETVSNDAADDSSHPTDAVTVETVSNDVADNSSHPMDGTGTT